MESGAATRTAAMSVVSGRSSATRSDALRTSTRTAAMARDKNVDGVGVGAYLHPVNGYRGELERKGVKPTDHARKNVEALREQQREMLLARELEAAASEKEAFKLKKFSSVESRVRASIEGSGDGSTVTSRSFLRKHEGAAPLPAPAPFDRPPREAAKPPVPRATKAAALAPREDKDFLRRNYIEAARLTPRRRSEPGSPTGPGVRKGYGEVPQYLVERREAAAEEERRLAALRDSDCPPGMTLMPEEERLDYLAVLRSSMAETNKLISRLPLKIETLGQVKRKTELEAKLKELEDAVAIFDKEKVYIAED